jgi:hypothetical protein
MVSVSRWLGRERGLLARRHQRRDGPALGAAGGFAPLALGLAFCAWAVIALAWSTSALDGIGFLFQVGILAVAFAYGAAAEP